jgi:HSP20 family protein
MDRDSWPESFRDFGEARYRDRWQPAVDVFETSTTVVVRVELPGVGGKDVRVKVEGENIRISGERKVPSQGDLKRLHQMEIAFGIFERVVRIPTAFEREQITAHLKDGFLEITLPTRQAVARRIEVEGE